MFFSTDWPRHTVQTKIRLLLEEQFDQGVHCLSLRLHLLEEFCEKTGFLHMQKNKDADQLCGNREADQRLCFSYIDR